MSARCHCFFFIECGVSRISLTEVCVWEGQERVVTVLDSVSEKSKYLLDCFQVYLILVNSVVK